MIGAKAAINRVRPERFFSTLLPPVKASPFWFANSEDHTIVGRQEIFEKKKSADMRQEFKSPTDTPSQLLLLGQFVQALAEFTEKVIPSGIFVPLCITHRGK